MKLLASFAMVLTLACVANAQGVTASFFNQYNVNQPASTSLGLSTPIPVLTLTDTRQEMNVQTFNVSAPVVMLVDSAGALGNTISINAWNMFNVQIDLRDKNSDGYAGDQVLFSGYETPNSETFTDATGALTAFASVPSCRSLTCITGAAFNQFEVSTQAICFDPTNAPFNMRSTPAVQGTFDNGYTLFSLSGDASTTYSFKQGFTFRYYGTTYSQCFVSANGFVSFGASDTGFPSPTTSSMRTGVPRIASFYNDLVPEDTSYGTSTRIYAQQFRDDTGLMKVKFVHDFLAEFSDQTGPHGGEIVITDDDDIAVFVPGYNGTPSINTSVGITPGNSIDSNVPGFGQDLTMRSGTAHVRGPGKSAFELFDHGNGGVATNPIDLIGFNFNPLHPVGSGVVFLKNTAATNTTPANSSYIIQ